MTFFLLLRFAGVSAVVWSFACAIGLAGDFDVEEPLRPAEEFGLTIRSTGRLSPQEERAGFHVPKGFVVDLIACEPTILKPMNLAFDEHGRLWVTQTKLYPFPAKDGEPAQDSLIVLEDKDRDGQFESSQIFADQLNIPIGVLPVKDGAICFSIPNILYLKDKNGDGKCDERHVLYGPFDTSRDTHGMVNSLRDGRDGWVYACHGFNNQSIVKGADGHEVSMTSGNIFRFKPDGSRIELYSQGQVNPFGMTQDRFGNWFAADCHSKPISQLLRGGCHPSFGRPDDGLGFVPAIMEHLHGSTAIAGLAHTCDSRFPKAMSDQFLSGNVMTCRINRNQIAYQGTLAKAVETTDLLTSEDSWFRPVDLVFGPDGHLYVADFYNKVIGHYEVPLNHPDRDRTSGRIWRIRWTGGDALDGSGRLPIQMSQLTATPELLKELKGLSLISTESAFRWLNQVDRLSEAGNVELLDWLLREAKRVADTKDPMLMQGYLIALRRTIHSSGQEAPSFVAKWIESELDQASVESLAALIKVLPALRDSRFTRLLLGLIKAQFVNKRMDAREVVAVLEKLAGLVDEPNMNAYLQLMVEATEQSGLRDIGQVADRLISFARLQREKQGDIAHSLQQHINGIFSTLVDSFVESDLNKSPLTSWLGTSPTDDRRAWPVQMRHTLLGNKTTKEIPVFSSFPLGENYVGSWASAPFRAPAKLTFAICGHNALPSEPDTKKNFARLWLVDLSTGEKQELYRAYPPRSDIAQTVEWDLAEFVGKDVIFEAVDQDKSDSYAWIAVGAFEPSELGVTQKRITLERILSLVSFLGAKVLPSDAISKLLAVDAPIDLVARFQVRKQEFSARSAVTTTIAEYAMEKQFWDLARDLESFLSDSDKTNDNSARGEETTIAVWKRLPSDSQSRLMNRISASRESPNRIVQWLAKGVVGIDSLRGIPSSWWDSLNEQQTKSLLPFREKLSHRSDRSDLVKNKLNEIRQAKADVGLGHRIFTDKCSVCHKLGATGNVLGPQLEGIGNRGEDRLCEDILWPDRNVDEAFRMTLFSLDDQTTVTGLVVERNENTIQVADQTGQKRSISVREIEQEKRSEVSLMPDNFVETLSAEELASLLAYLKQLAKRK